MPLPVNTGSSGNAKVDEFLARAVRKPSPARGNIIIALDATASRQPSWDMATHLQSQMFAEVAALGLNSVQAVYFRGSANADAECKSSQWLNDPTKLANFMGGIVCRAGLTQWTRTLDHALRETNTRKVDALILVGDTVEEPRDHLIPLARRLNDQHVPIFAFQEGNDANAEAAFREMALLTGGAFSKFDAGSARQLGELLRAIAVLAVGGVKALENQNTAAATLLLQQMK